MIKKYFASLLAFLFSAVAFAAPIPPVNGGTGISNNNANTLSINGNYPTTLNLTGSTSVTLPTSGTLTTAENSSPGKTLRVTASGSNFSGCGQIAIPCSTVSYATTQASPLASSSNPYTILVDGVITEAGNLSLYQNVNIQGQSGAVINLPSGGLILSGSGGWGTQAGSVIIQNVAINADNGIFLNFQSYSSQANIVQFSNVDFLNSDGVNFLGTGSENIYLSGVHTSIYPAIATLLTDVNGVIDSSFFGDLSLINDDGYAANTTVKILGSTIGNLYLSSPGIQSITLFSTASSQAVGTSITIDGSNAFWYVDAASYNSQPIFLDSATTDNVVITSLSDSINVTYTPSNYSPINTGEYGLNSLSAHLAGIDAALMPSSSQGFSAYLSTPQANVTGDGTIYPLVCDAQDVSSLNYNNITGVYTADKDGYYQFSASVNLYNLDSGMSSMKLWLYTTLNNYVLDGNNPYVGKDGSGDFTSIGSATVYMNAGDTAYIGVEVDGGPKQVGIYSSSNPIFAFFGGGYLGPTIGGGDSGNVTVTDDNTTDANFYPAFVSGTSGSQAVYVSSSKFKFNPSSGVITGDLFGTATYASYVGINNTSANVDIYPMLSSTTSGNNAPYTSNNFHFNPSTGILSADGLNLSGLTTSSLIATDGSNNLISDTTTLTPTFTGLNLSGLSVSEMVVTDSSKNLASVPFGNDVNGLTIDSTLGISASAVTSSHAVLNNNIVTLTERIDFTPSATNPSIYLAPPFSPTFTGSNQVDGMCTVVKTSGGSATDGFLASMVTITSGGANTFLLQLGVVSTGVNYALYCTEQYSINN